MKQPELPVVYISKHLPHNLTPELHVNRIHIQVTCNMEPNEYQHIIQGTEGTTQSKHLNHIWISK